MSIIKDEPAKEHDHDSELAPGRSAASLCIAEIEEAAHAEGWLMVGLGRGLGVGLGLARGSAGNFRPTLWSDGTKWEDGTEWLDD